MKHPRRSSDVPQKDIGIWIRVSTEDQVRGESPEHHERRARAFAESKGWNVVTVYSLEALSGKSVMGFPETQRMLGDIRSGRITGIIFSKLARLARNTRELLDFADIFREQDADLVSLQESIDTSTPAGRLFYTMIAAMAQWEREEIADRVAASVPIRAKMGKPLGGPPPFGYRWDGREVKVHEKEAPVRRLMYDLFLQHRKKKVVARLLNEAGHRTRNGSKFGATTIDRLLRDTTAKGVRRANYTKSEGGGRWHLKPESDWVLSAVEPIVSEEVWEQCNAELDKIRAPLARTGRPAVRPFSKLTWCACGGKMYCLSNSPKYTCQKCRNKMPADDLDAVFREQLKEFFLSSDELTALLDAADEGISQKQELLRVAEVERADVQAEMDKIYRLYVSDQISVEGFGRSYRPLEERLKQLDDRVPTLQAELDFARISNTSRDEIVSKAQDLYARWPDLTRDEKRDIAEGIVERITIGDGDVAIDLLYLPTPSELIAKRSRNQPVAVPFCKFKICAKKPKEKAYPTDFKHVGHHIRARRLDLKLNQPEVATMLGVSNASINRWECGVTAVPLQFLPRVVEWLGFDPRPVPEGFGPRLRRHREDLGLSAVGFARSLGVNKSTLLHWENGRHKPMRRGRTAVAEVFSGSERRLAGDVARGSKQESAAVTGAGHGRTTALKPSRG